MPREGHDRRYHKDTQRRCEFQSTCPARGTTHRHQYRDAETSKFQSTCPARGTTAESGIAIFARGISIHVPREGHDSTPLKAVSSWSHFNPRAPRGARPVNRVSIATANQFQSTCPARGTTYVTENRRASMGFQSTCPARGTTMAGLPKGINADISIHVPREGHDASKAGFSSGICYFNPRAPRGARQHSPVLPGLYLDFNPRAPRGARRVYEVLFRSELKFQSTCPARGTTAKLYFTTSAYRNFNPRAPRGARLSS